MEKVDCDGSGTIDYSEFVTGCVDLKNLLNARQLEYAFSQFDEVSECLHQDGSGQISKKELKMILGVGCNSHIPEEVFEEIIKEVDENSDGEISFLEFERMMNKIIKG